MNKKVIFFSILAVLGFAGVVIALLVFIKPTPLAEKTEVINDPAAIIAKIGVTGTIPSLGGGLEKSEPKATSMYYKAKGKEYLIDVSSSFGYQYTATSPNQSDITVKVRTDIKHFFSTIGFTRTAENQQYNNVADLVDTFESDTTVCQSSILDGLNSVKDTYRFACILKSAFDAPYKKIDSLVALAKKEQDPGVFTVAKLTETVDNTKAYQLLTLYGIPISDDAVTSKVLLFASVSGVEEFIGELKLQAATPGAILTGTYVITPAIKTKMSQAKYGTFLTDAIK